MKTFLKLLMVTFALFVTQMFVNARTVQVEHQDLVVNTGQVSEQSVVVQDSAYELQNQIGVQEEIIGDSNTESVSDEIVIDLSTFAGIVALISLIVTQLCKVVPAFNTAASWVKILVSAVIGILTCMLSWFLQIADPLLALSWWQALIYGLCAGLAACGFYDAIKALIDIIFKPSK